MLDLVNTLRSILPGMWAQRWWGLVVAGLVGAAGIVVAMAIPDHYAATARLYVDTQSILKPLMNGLAVQPNLDQQVSMMARTLISRPNIENLVRMADLDRRVTSPKARDALVDGLLADILLKPGPANNIYMIEYHSRDGEEARKVVQALLSIFVESNLGGKRRDSEQALTFIGDQIAIYEKKLADAELALKTFKLRNLDVMPNLAQDYVTRTNTAQADLNRSRLELRQAESARQALSAQLRGELPALRGRQPGYAATVDDMSGGADYDYRLEVQRQKLVEMRLRLTDDHPDVIDQQRLVKSLEGQIEARRRAPRQQAPATGGGVSADPGLSAGAMPNKVYQDLRLAVAEADAKVASLQAAVADAQQRLSDAKAAARVVPEVEAEYAQLNRDYEVNKKNYEQLVSRRDAAAISGSMDATAGVGEIRVIDPPRVSTKPVWPNRALLLVLAFIASVGAGVMTVILRDQLQPRFFDLRALRAVTGLPVIGVISLTESREFRQAQRQATIRFAGGLAAYMSTFAATIVIVTYGQFGS